LNATGGAGGFILPPPVPQRGKRIFKQGAKVKIVGAKWVDLALIFGGGTVSAVCFALLFGFDQTARRWWQRFRLPSLASVRAWWRGFTLPGWADTGLDFLFWAFELHNDTDDKRRRYAWPLRVLVFSLLFGSLFLALLATPQKGFYEFFIGLKNVALAFVVPWGIAFFWAASATTSSLNEFGRAFTLKYGLDFALRSALVALMAVVFMFVIMNLFLLVMEGRFYSWTWKTPVSAVVFLVICFLGPVFWLIRLYMASDVFKLEQKWEDARQREIPPEDPNAGGWATLADVKRAGLFNKEGLPVGWFGQNEQGQPFRIRYAGESHVVTIGLPRTGKGTDIIIPALLEYPGSALVIDPKAELAAVTARHRLDMGHKVFIINPYNVFSDVLRKRAPEAINGAAFNPLRRLDYKMPGFVGQVRNIAQSLVIGGAQDKDSYFVDSARDLVSCLIMAVCKDAAPEDKNLGQVRALLAQRYDEPGEGLALVLEEMAASDFASLRQTAAQFLDIKSKDVPAIIRTAQQQLAFLDEPEIVDSLNDAEPGRAFDFADMKREKITVFLVLPVEELSDKAKWFRLLVASSIGSLLRGGKGGRVLMLLDEFALLGRLSAIADNLGVLGGMNIQLWPILQNLGQLWRYYQNEAEGFLSTAGVLQFLSLFDETTAKEVVRRAGQVRERKTTYSQGEVSQRQRDEGMRGASSSTSHSWENLLSPSFLYKLPRNEQILFVPGSEKTFRASRFSYREVSKLRALADENPLHS
jgi:type IV secretion system protein VirD4